MINVLKMVDIILFKMIILCTIGSYLATLYYHINGIITLSLTTAIGVMCGAIATHQYHKHKNGSA